MLNPVSPRYIRAHGGKVADAAITPRPQPASNGQQPKNTQDASLM